MDALDVLSLPTYASVQDVKEGKANFVTIRIGERFIHDGKIILAVRGSGSFIWCGGCYYKNTSRRKCPNVNCRLIGGPAMPIFVEDTANGRY